MNTLHAAAATQHHGQVQESPLVVVCLCAAWCGVCRQYRGELETLAAKWPQVRFEWLDVEDEEDLVGDVDVETFPTLLISTGDQALFLGALLPQIQVLERLVASLLDETKASSSLPLEAQPLWQRIARHLQMQR